MNPEARLAARLKHMQWLATGLLLCMAAVLISARLLSDNTVMRFVEAFAEAAVIGALADWFAVTALFRRPLGLPIPHTAIVPQRKDDIGAALARFVRDNFLIRDAFSRRLVRVDFAARVGVWLQEPGNARRVAGDLATGIDWLLNALESQVLRDGLKETLASAVHRTPVNAGLAALLEVVISGDYARALVDGMVEFGQQRLESNKQRIRARIKAESPWWLPRFVDEEIYDKLVTEFERILAEIGADPDHEARRALRASLSSLADDLTADPVLGAKADALKAQLLSHPAWRRYAADTTDRIREQLSGALRDPNSDLSRRLTAQIMALGERLVTDPDAAARLNRWMRDIIAYLVESYRGPVSEIISDTIERWDAQATADRIELHIGRDLQFIRINGTLVGGLVGLGLYCLWELGS